MYCTLKDFNIKWTRFARLVPSVCRGSQQTLDLLVLGNGRAKFVTCALD